MQKVVLIAKNTPVWLGQLAKKYHKPVQKLDEIPDKEFLYLKSMGINALWLLASGNGARLREDQDFVWQYTGHCFRLFNLPIQDRS